MVRQSKTKKPDFVGNGKVTPVQIAFIVDRYLLDNCFTQTQSVFRSEASHLLPKSPVGQVPKSLLGLGAILEDYITLKEQKLYVDKERRRLEQESLKVHNFFKGMQDVTNAYNAGTNHAFAPLTQLQSSLVGGNSSNSMFTSPPMVSVSRPWSNGIDSNHFFTPITNNNATKKRKGSKNVSGGEPSILKRSHKCTQTKDVNVATQVKGAETNQENTLPCSSQLQGSNVVKCLFNQTPQPTQVNASLPKTPPHASSSSCFESEKSTSPSETCSLANFTSKDATPQGMMSTNCTMISSQTIHVSPNKQISYCSVENNRLFSTCSPVKTRLNFDASDTGIVMENQSPNGNTSASESDKGDNLDMEIPNLDAFGSDFNLSEFLLAFDMECEGLDLSSQAPDSSPDSYTCPSSSLIDARQQVSSDVRGILENKDMNVIGSDSIATMRSVTKCVVLSPVKSQRSCSYKENTPARN